MKGLGKFPGVQVYGSFAECKGPVMSLNFQGLKASGCGIYPWKMVMKLQCAPDFIVPPDS